MTHSPTPAPSQVSPKADLGCSRHEQTLGWKAESWPQRGSQGVRQPRLGQPRCLQQSPHGILASNGAPELPSLPPKGHRCLPTSHQLPGELPQNPRHFAQEALAGQCQWPTWGNLVSTLRKHCRRREAWIVIGWADVAREVSSLLPPQEALRLVWASKPYKDCRSEL